MHIGIDFDNTLINYSEVFAFYTNQLTKHAAKSFLQAKKDGNKLWTKLQCQVYGEGIVKAKLSAGVIQFLIVCKRKNIPVSIISHKTKTCAEGKHHDIRTPAYSFLKLHNFYSKTGIFPNAVFFEETRRDKLLRIEREHCTHFIDDLIEVFEDIKFPKNVAKILFAANLPVENRDILQFTNWKDMQNYFLFKSRMDSKKWIASEFEDLVHDRVASFVRLKGGINSIAYYVKTDRREYVVKKYLQQKSDLRDRLATEFRIVSYLWEKGVRNIRQPLFQLEKEKIGVYQYIKGKPFQENEIAKSDVLQVAQFLKTLFKLSKHKDASYLPQASESARNMKEYQNILDKRLLNLIHIKMTSPYNKELSDILDLLVPLYQRINEAVQTIYKVNKQPLHTPFPSVTLSPSDIGFSNILKSADGTLFFYDFEYAGWDDPAKTISDFYLHPAVSLPLKYRELFFQELIDITDSQDMYNRLGLVYLLLSIKWCMIMLNPFLKMSKQGVGQKEYRQFVKVKKRLHNIEDDIAKRVFPISLLDRSIRL